MTPYDNYEINPCRRFEDKPGHFYFEPCEPHEADVWTLYGHLPEGGVTAIGDFLTREHAEEVFQRITGMPFAGRDEIAARLRLMHAAPNAVKALEAAKDAGYLEGGYQATVDLVENVLTAAGYPLPPDPEGMNSSRADWAGYALAAFQSQTGADDGDAVADLLANLMHWCDRNTQDFDAALDRARMHYEAETAGEDPADSDQFACVGCKANRDIEDSVQTPSGLSCPPCSGEAA